MGAVIAVLVYLCEPHCPVLCPTTAPSSLYPPSPLSPSSHPVILSPSHHAQGTNSSPCLYFLLLTPLSEAERIQTRSHESAKKATLQIRFVIIGGGAAGLSCAVALRRVGHHVIVLEKGPNFIGVRTKPVPSPLICTCLPTSYTAKQEPRYPYAT